MSNRLPARQRDPDAAPAGAGTLVARNYWSFDDLPEGYDALFAQCAKVDPCLTRAWFEATARHLLAPSERLLMIGAEPVGPPTSPAALLVGRARARDPLAYGGHSFTSLDSVYSLLFAPLIGPRWEAAEALAPICTRICDPAGGGRRPYDLVRLQPLDPETRAFEALRSGLREAGFAVQTYRQFGNAFEPSHGLRFAEYLARRPSRLRNTLRRGERGLACRAQVDFVVETGGSGRDSALDAALAHYGRVYAASWKAAEPRADFVAAFVRLLAAAGALRLGLLLCDGTPVAAQIWALWHGRAILYKLAHDQHFDRHSPGSVLTAHMIARLLDAEGAHELDFGPGDDAYKADWTTERRERWGLLAFNPKTARGHLGIARHIWGRAAKRRLSSLIHAA